MASSQLYLMFWADFRNVYECLTMDTYKANSSLYALAKGFLACYTCEPYQNLLLPKHGRFQNKCNNILFALLPYRSTHEEKWCLYDIWAHVSLFLIIGT
jgi:hypothetical protein